MNTKLPICLLLAQTVAGCGGGGSAATPSATALPSVATTPPPVVASPSAAGWGGRYVGTAKIADRYYFADALLTADGSVSLYVGGEVAASEAPSGSGALQTTKPPDFSQLVAQVAIRGIEATGNAVSVSDRGAVMAGNIRIVVQSERLQGEIQLSTSTAALTLLLDMQSWTGSYVLSAKQQSLQGLYQEQLAGFAVGTDTIVSIDLAGRLFFQSATSGCTGNGTVRPHLDGLFNVYDVTLSIAGCKPAYGYLNASYQGLASTSPSNYWAYDSVLRIWLTEQSWEMPTGAIMMSARRL